MTAFKRGGVFVKITMRIYYSVSSSFSPPLYLSILALFLYDSRIWRLPRKLDS